MSVAHVMTWV